MHKKCSKFYADNLMVNGEPMVQPAIEYGIRYREPWSRNTRTGWFRDKHKIPRDEVASVLGVTVKELIAWENATDLEVELESREEFGDY